MRVFVVEDSATLREHLIQILSDLKGIEVIGYAADAHTALEQIRNLRPDLVLLDIRLYQSNGFQVLQGIRRLDRLGLIMVLSNYAYPEYRKKFLESGANYFFDKSTEFEQALKVLKRLGKRALLT